MKKLVLAVLVILLTVGLALTAQAGKNDRTPEWVITFQSDCENEGNSYSMDGDDLISATWTATDEGQTKYGGDAKFKVFGVFQNGSEMEPLMAEIGLMLANDMEDSEGKFVYECDELGGVEGPCIATLDNLQLAIMNYIEDGINVYTYPEGASATFLGIYIKGMNPSVGEAKFKRQNYVQEICGFYEILEDEPVEPTVE